MEDRIPIKEPRITRLQRYSALLLILPVAFSILDTGGWISDAIPSIMPGDIEEQKFRTRLIYDILGAASAFAAFIILLRLAADKAVRTATRIIQFSELYMLLYYCYMFILPGGRSVESDALGSIGLLISIMASCYAWSILLARPGLENKERRWMIFIPMQYIMSFVAFYAMTWQQYIPSADKNTSMLLDYTFLYTLFALLWNVLRCIALWKACNANIYNGKYDDSPVAEGTYAFINRYTVAIAIASFLTIQGLALVYMNYDTLLTL